MAHRWFDDYNGDDPGALAFLDALNAAVEADPLPAEPDDAWLLPLGPLLYLVVAVPALQSLRIGVDLEIGYRPGHPVRAGWGDSEHPLDRQIVRAELPAGDPESCAATTLDWLRLQLARPLQRRGWTGSSAYRVVLADTGVVIGGHGRRRLRRPDLVEPLR